MRRPAYIGLGILLVGSVTPSSAPICDVCSISCSEDECDYIGWFEFNDYTCDACMGDLDLHCQGCCDKYDCYDWFCGPYDCWARDWETSDCDFCCD